MLVLRKTAVAVLALGSSAVFAGTMGPVCTPGNATVPCEKNAWNFGAKALYLQSYAGGDLSVAGNQPIGNADGFAVGATQTQINFNPGWSWGFFLEGSYHFSTGKDVNVNWYHWNSDTSRKTFGSDFGLLLPITGGTTFTAALDSNWDQVNVEYGQHVDLGEGSDLRLHGGFQWSSIKVERTDTSTNAAGTANITNYAESKYNGFGPRVGVDYSYDWGNGLSVYAKGAASVLVGDSDQLVTSSPNSTTAAQYGTRFGSDIKNVVAPELEGKLGVDYTFAMAQGDVTLDVGYMWNSYLGALQQIIEYNETNFGVQGLYFGGKWVGNLV